MCFNNNSKIEKVSKNSLHSYISLMEHYSIKEFKKFIKFVDNIVYKSFFTFLYYAGVRPGEAMVLKFSDLNFKEIYISKTIDEHTNEFGVREIGTPKTLSSVRNFKLDNFLYKDLLKLKQYCIEKYKDENYDYFIFGGIKPLVPTTINRHKIKACNKAELRPIQLREFRRSHATLLYNMNVPMQLIKDRLGHSDINTTMKYYVDL